MRISSSQRRAWPQRNFNSVSGHRTRSAHMAALPAPHKGKRSLTALNSTHKVLGFQRQWHTAQAEVTERLLDRLEDCQRTFPVAAVLGGAGTAAAARLAGGRAGMHTLLHIHGSPGMGIA